ncbi:uncharacterized protein SPSC_05776 [Sporisorium scitamineum]|uniref:Ricin B lectin domain-containing protein n=1 Tax=Sporisorium scitamineum TaxID=49012 RepID=A0A0F7RXS8_9BASI|nr:uncharacterized protein SPSC_05776 [Sporisorium scitamineum]CDR99884.1 hypothetical protein [Sporisorium scitamineum]
MTFPRALLLSALLGSAALAAPISSTCQPALKQWGQITYDGVALSLGEDGDFMVGGPNPINFAVATCETQYIGKYTQQSKGYLVDATDATRCLTASNLDQANATFSFQDCRYNGAGDIWSSQSFAYYWDNDGANNDANGYFNGENYNAVNSSQPPIYSFKTQYDKLSFDGTRGKLLVDYTPNLTSLPAASISIPEGNLPVTAPAQGDAPALNCESYQVGQLNFNNQTSSSNQYDGPLNSKWEADASTSDEFIFEQCDYSPSGIKAEGDIVYGRLRPSTELQDSTFSCYAFQGTGLGDWIMGLQLQTCAYSTADAQDTAKEGIDVIKLNKSDNTVEWVTFTNGTQTGVYSAYTQLDYDREYGVTQHVWDDLGTGHIKLSPDNQNLTKYPPGKVTFLADP